MTLEFENPPLLSDKALNPSYNNDPDFSVLDIGGVKSVKTSVISRSKKNSLPSEGEGKIIREMSDRYSDDYDSYGDDFESPSPTKQHNRIHSSRQSRLTARDRSRSSSYSPPRYRSKKTSTRKDSFASYRSTYGANRGRPAKGKKTQSAASKLTTKSTGSDSSMMKRILSANRIKVSRLHNIMEELQQKVEELKQENKSLKRLSHRQEKEIKKIEEEEASLPLLLQRHSAEMRTLKENCRRNQEKLQRKEKEGHVRDEEIQRLKDTVYRYQELSKDKKLEERAVLVRKLENMKKDVAEKDKKITDLEKTIMLKDKARQREMKDHKDRYKQAKEELKRIQDDCRSLRDRLQEKEKELESKNIYHQRISQQKKKDGFLAALPAGTAPLLSGAMAAPEIRAEPPTEVTQKRTNVFLTNTVIFDKDGGQNVDGISLRQENRQQQSTATHSGVTAESLMADKQRREHEDRLRSEEEARRRLEEEERRRLEERRRREEEEARRKRVEEERRREEEERIKREREEEERKKQEEEQAEIRRKKDLLLARLRAIDDNSGPNDSKPSVTGSVGSHSDGKPSKLPIFLQSDKPIKDEQPKVKATVAADNDMIFDVGGKRPSASSKHSGYSYEFKQTVENLHHGLPAHASHEHGKTAAAKESSFEELSFGSYKPTAGRRAAPKRDIKDKDDLSFGSYNPSFVSKKDTTRRQSGLDFGTGKKVVSENELNGLIFGDYGPSTKDATSEQNGSIFSEKRSSPVQTRRARDNRSTAASTFGEDIFGSNYSKPTSNPLFGEKSYNNAKSAYPWENKVNVSKMSSEIDSQKDSLLPRRRRLQSVGKAGAETNVRAVENALNDVDDDIEEVIL